MAQEETEAANPYGAKFVRLEQRGPVLTVRMVDVPDARGGKAMMLCDANGEPLPGQTRCVLEQVFHGAGTLTVTFRVDGKAVALAG